MIKEEYEEEINLSDEDLDRLIGIYTIRYGECPPMVMGMTYSHPIFQRLIKNAIDTKTEITCQMVDEELKKHNIQYDTVWED